MDLTRLLSFLPLIIGAFLAYHLIFRQGLPSQGIGSILTYFVGIIIVFFAVSWLIRSFLAEWATDLLQVGTTSTEWQEFIDESEGVVDDALGLDDNTGNEVPTAVPPTPSSVNESAPVPTRPSEDTLLDIEESTPEEASGPIRHTVQFGDTLFSLARRYGTTVSAIKHANGLVSDTIVVDSVLIIPASSP